MQMVVATAFAIDNPVGYVVKHRSDGTMEKNVHDCINGLGEIGAVLPCGFGRDGSETLGFGTEQIIHDANLVAPQGVVPVLFGEHPPTHVQGTFHYFIRTVSVKAFDVSKCVFVSPLSMKNSILR